MVKFRTQEPSLIKNLAGGPAYQQSDKLELVSLLLTSFVADTHYDKASDQLTRLQHLVSSIPDKKFIAKAAIFARNTYGMRSITHALIGELAASVKEQTWLKHAIAAAIRRPDDILEITAYYLLRHSRCGYKKGLSAALRKGIAQALTKFDDYQLAKYRGDSAAVKMVDVVNLVHPKSNDSLTKLMKGELKNTDTWEAKLSHAGQVADNAGELLEAKATAWKELVETKKLGYFALLKNLRNIIEQAPDVVPLACGMLIDAQLIKRSLVLPFRYLTAIQEIEKVPGDLARLVIMALNTAAERALDNVPKLAGRTLVALDCSGSMSGRYFQNGSLFAGCIIKANNADLLVFNEVARMVQYNPADQLLTLASRIQDLGASRGTDFRNIFNVAAKYDRIIIISDMQAWVGNEVAHKAAEAYKKRTNAEPFIHCIDLAGSGTMQFPENKVCCIAGFSEKIFEVLATVEQDRSALLHAIEAVALPE